MEKSLQQYLELYTLHKDLLCRRSAKGFNILREDAYKALTAAGLPKKGSENYEISDIPGMLSPDYGLNISRLPLDSNPGKGFKCGVPHLSSSMFFILNDMWAESKDARKGLPEGVEIGPLSRFVDDEQKRYGRLANLLNPVVALNTLLVQEGVYIKVKRGVKVEKPVQLLHFLEGMVPLMAMRRILLILEEEAEIKILSCSHSAADDVALASVGVAEIYAGKNSRLDFYDMEESGKASRRLTALYLEQEEGSNVLIDNFTLHNGETRNEYHCMFRGRDASLRLYGMGIEGSDSVIDNYSCIRHECADCHTEELFKYVLDDASKGGFTGLVYVAPGASKTEAYQSNRNLISSDKARIFTKPQLEIYNDDVKCSHGSATGRVDPVQMFYLRSRGLSEDEALFLLKQAFVADVIDGVRLPSLRDRLHILVEKRFEGYDSTCGECGVLRNKCNV